MRSVWNRYAQAVVVFGCVVMAAASCKSRVDPKVCKDTTDRLERRLIDESRQLDAMSAVKAQLDQDAELPRVAGGKTTFEPGLALWLDTETFPDAIAAEACGHHEGPVRVYLLAAPSDPTSLLVARVAWLEAAARAWKLSIEPLLVVRLPGEVEYTPWPGHPSAELKKFAYDMFAMNDVSARTAKLKSRLERAAGDCFAAIGKQVEKVGDGTPLAYQLALPHGLRDCGCRGVNLDEVVATYHILELARTDVAWARLSTSTGTALTAAPSVGELVSKLVVDDKTTARLEPGAAASVPPLACRELQPIVLRRVDRWDPAPPPELGDAVSELLERLGGCLERYGLDRSAVASLRFSTSSLGDHGQLEVDLDTFGRSRDTWDLHECMRASFDLKTPADGSTAVDVLLPVTKTAAAPR